MEKNEADRLVDLVMAEGDKLAAKARDERDRARDLKRDEARKAKLAHEHAWALRKEAEGYWGAAHIIRREFLDRGDEGEKTNG